MKKSLVRISVLFLIVSTSACKSTLLTSSLTNTLDTDRKNQAVVLKNEDVNKLKGKDFKVSDKNGTTIPYQWVRNAQDTMHPDLLLLTDFSPKETKEIVFKKGKPSKEQDRVFGRYVPERFGDFAWENDVIAFRMYGKPLESKPEENAYGMDVWAKKTKNMVVNKWYKTADYHHDHGEGLDFFKVGASLGAGDALPFLGDTLDYLGNFVSSRILDSGPLRFSFQLDYPEVTVGQYHISAIKTISLDAGSHMNKISVSYQFTGGESLPIFAGIVHWNDSKGIQMIDQDRHFATYWEPAQGDAGSIATAIGFPNSSSIVLKNTQEHLGGTFNVKSGETFTYFNGATWNKAGEITSPAAWDTFVANYIANLKNPIQVILKK